MNESEVKASKRKGLVDSALGTRNLMIIAALAIVGLVILVPLNYVSASFIMSPELITIGCALMGLWVIPYLLPSAVVKRPGSTVLACTIIGIICIFLTPTGPMAIVGNLIGGLMLEIPLALCLYKYKWWSFLVASAVFGALNGLMYLGYLEVFVGMAGRVGMVLISVASAVIGGVITLALARALKKAGVGNNSKAAKSAQDK